jgi:hypothetical protein
MDVGQLQVSIDTACFAQEKAIFFYLSTICTASGKERSAWEAAIVFSILWQCVDEYILK